MQLPFQLLDVLQLKAVPGGIGFDLGAIRAMLPSFRTPSCGRSAALAPSLPLDLLEEPLAKTVERIGTVGCVSADT
jgi:hypothetical protein